MKKIGLLVLAGAVIVGGWLLFRRSKANAQNIPPPVTGDTGVLVIKARMGKMPMRYEYKIDYLVPMGENIPPSLEGSMSDSNIMISGQEIILPVGDYFVRVIAYYLRGDAIANLRTTGYIKIQKDKKFIFYYNSK